MVGTWSFSGLEISDDVSERVFVVFCQSKFFDGSSNEVHMLAVYVRINVRPALVLQTVGEGGGFVLICEDDAVVRAFQRFGHFPDRLVLEGLESLFPLFVLKIEQCLPDFPLEAVRCSLIASFSGSSCSSSRFVLFPDEIRDTLW